MAQYDGKITLAVRVDDSGLKKGTNTIKNAGREMGAAFRKAGQDMAVSLGLADKNIGRLQDNFEKASKAVQRQTEKVRELEDQLSKLKSGEITVEGKGVEKMRLDFEKTTQKADDLANKIADLAKQENRIIAGATTIPKPSNPGDLAAAKMRGYGEIEGYNNTLFDENTVLRVKELDAQINSLKDSLDQTEKKASMINAAIKSANDSATQKSIAKTENNLQAANTRLEELKDKAGQAGEQLKSGFSSAGNGISKFTSRIANLAKRVFVFSMITRGLRSVREELGNVLMGDEEFRNSLASLKAAIWTAFAPIYNYVLPALKALVNFVTQAIMTVVRFISMLTGTTAEQLTANAKKLYNQAKAYKNISKSAKSATKEQNKQLASFDKVNTIGENKSTAASGASGTADTSAPNFNGDKLKDKITGIMADLQVAAAGFALALGVILTATGNYAIGIPLIAVGALMLASAISVNWNKMSEKVKKVLKIIDKVIAPFLIVLGIILLVAGVIPLGVGVLVAGLALKFAAATMKEGTMKDKIKKAMTEIFVIVAAATLVLGAILIFTGIKLPLGIALIALGAASLVASIKLSESTMSNKIKKWVTIIGAIVGGAFLVLGIILVATGVSIPLGIKLIAVGAASLVGVAALNWNYITDKVKEIWGNIKKFWQDHIAPVFTREWWRNLADKAGEGLKIGFKAAVNGIIGFAEKAINWIIGKVNTLSIDIPDWVPGDLGGKTFGINIPLVSIPRLAQGAVLPPNKPFYAELGDQKNGRNLEAPESLLREVYAEENAPVTALLTQIVALLRKGQGIYLNGREVGRTFKEEIERENNRVGRGLVVS